MKYQLLWISSEDGQVYSNGANSKEELKRKINYFMNIKNLKLNDNDKFDNIQVSKKISRNHYEILSTNEVFNKI
jgi:alpha-tubulin suppressor-like RCC1 family protein